ncbi:MAG: hypothetical protein IJA34_04235 [Lachnospiraceae bacterium]|nr:hypothetical protein [Lachnospiraceae bacterium]
MEAITIDGLKVSEFSKGYSIVDIKFEIKSNSHGHAKILLRVLDGSVPENELKKVQNKIISINSTDVGVLFKGYVEYSQVIQQKNEHILDLQLISTSVKLDEKLRSYSFQNEKLTIKDVIEEAISDDDGICEYIDSDIKNKEIKIPIIRYRESTWEFVCRVASKYWMPIFIDEIADKPTLKVGIKGDGTANNNEFLTKNYKKELNIEKYLIRKNNSKDNVKIEQYKSIEVTSYANYKIGMSASYDGISGIILEKQAYLDGGELVFKYVIADTNLYSPTPFYNKKLHGRCLEGKVVKCENEDIKLQLTIDVEAEKEKCEKDLFFFPWQPETGNLMYCMPEEGTMVSLYIGAKDEGEAIVINNLRKNKGTDTDNPQNRYFTSADGKRMYYKKDEIGFSNDGKDRGKTYLYARDKDVIYFGTNRSINIQADGKIDIKSDRKITAKSLKSMNILNNSSSVNLNGKFNIYPQGTILGLGVALSECIEQLENVSFDGMDAKTAQEKYNTILREYVFNREDLSNHDKVELMRILSTKLSFEQMKDFNILSTADSLKPDSEGTAWGEWAPIKWPKRMGLAKGQEEISRDNPIPENLDRIGSPGGTNFGVMRDDDYVYTQNDRAITYIENDNAYHTYKFDNTYYFDYIDVISDEKQKTPDKLNEMVKNNIKEDDKFEDITQEEFEKMKETIQKFEETQSKEKMGTNSKYGLIGKAERWNIEGNKIAKGGAGQLNTPINGAMLIKLGVMKEV